MSEFNQDDNNLVVRSGSGCEISFQVLQDVYNTITGKTETIFKPYFDCYELRFSDLKNLHSALEQTLEQYNCVSSSCSITLRYSDGKSERFSGFSRFELQGLSRNVCIEEVELDYDFLIILPKTKEAKTYNVVISLRSTLGVMHGHNLLGASDAARDLFARFDRGTAKLIVHYVDLAVARNFEGTFEGWFASLPRKKFSIFRIRAPLFSRPISFLARSLSIVLVAYLMFRFHASAVVDLQSLFKIGILSAAAFTVVNAGTLYLGIATQAWLGRMIPYSFINLSSADEDAERSHTNVFLRRWGKVFLAALSSIIVGLITAYITKWLDI